MARKIIKKLNCITIDYSFLYMENGQPHVENGVEKLYGRKGISEAGAIRYIENLHGYKNVLGSYIINSISKSDVKVSIDIDTLIKNAQIIEGGNE